MRPTPGKAGDSRMMNEQCDPANAVGCNTVSRQCIKLAVAPAGGACGLDPVEGELAPDFGRPGLGLELKRKDAERFLVGDT